MMNKIDKILMSVGKTILRKEPEIEFNPYLYLPKRIWDQLSETEKIVIIQENREHSVHYTGFMTLMVLVLLSVVIIDQLLIDIP